MSAVKDMALVEASPAVSMFERLVKDESVDVGKLEKLIELQMSMMRHQAKADFDAAFADMQGELPIITKRGEIVVNGTVRSTYAKHEDIQRECRPILKKYGFSVRHRNEFADGQHKIIGILSHRSGHSEQDEFVAAADTSGGKAAIQAIGSTREYGRRYTTISLLNITTEDEDDDGQKAGQSNVPAPPDGYEAWLGVLSGEADAGLAVLQASWGKSKNEFRAYLTKHEPAIWNNLKTKAAKIAGVKA